MRKKLELSKKIANSVHSPFKNLKHEHAVMASEFWSIPRYAILLPSGTVNYCRMCSVYSQKTRWCFSILFATCP